MPFQALDLFVPIESPVTFLRSRYNTLRVHDPRRRLTRMALSPAHGPGQVAGHFRPNSIGAKPIVPPPHGFPGAKILGEIRPGATSPLQIETGINHFPQIHRQSGVSRENHLDRFPFRVGKIARVAAVVISVLFPMSRCPHRSIFPSASTEREESQSKGL